MAGIRETMRYYSRHKKIVRAGLKKAGMENIKISNGYYYFSGFATNPRTGKIVYFSIGDVRDEIECGRPIREVLIRTAKSYEDFTGGSNHYAKLNPSDVAEMARFLTED